MPTASENNKRIAKNTMFLYFRSLLTLGVGLYTSREVLTQLGVSDFGLYNVVGGVIILFSFIQNGMASATSRFFTFDLGKGDFEKLKQTFSLSIIIHVITALVILILGETIGLWFLNTQLNIPSDRMGAANFVYQISIFTACIGILQMPYMIAINAHERMKIYAYAGIADAIFKLAVALSLGFASFDKLKFYSVLLFSVYFVMVVFYRVYCHRNFKETHFKWFWNKEMFFERIGFSGWTTLVGISTIAAMQGVNMLLNVFHGVIANAAYGIMTQVSNAVVQFSTNLTAAFNPQVIKSYAKNDMEYLYSLIFRFSRFSFLLVSLFAIPLILNMDFILNLWLKQVPDFAVIFCQIKLIDFIFYFVFHSLLDTSISATGRIKFFRIVDSIIISMIFVFSYISLKLNFSPIVVPVIFIVVNFIRIISINIFAKHLFYFPIRNFCKKVLSRLLVIVTISLPLPILLHLNINNINMMLSFFITSSTFLFLFLPSGYFIGLEYGEKAILKNKIYDMINRLSNVFK